MADYLLCYSALENMQVLFHTQITYNTEEHLNYIIAENIIHFCLSLTYIKSSIALGHIVCHHCKTCCRVVREKDIRGYEYENLVSVIRAYQCKNGTGAYDYILYIGCTLHHNVIEYTVYPYIICRYVLQYNRGFLCLSCPTISLHKSTERSRIAALILLITSDCRAEPVGWAWKGQGDDRTKRQDTNVKYSTKKTKTVNNSIDADILYHQTLDGDSLAEEYSGYTSTQIRIDMMGSHYIICPAIVGETEMIRLNL